MKGRLTRNGPLAPAGVVAWVRQAAVALDHAHVGGLVHRDVKHANLLLRGDGDRRLILAECGTVAYMAPEHFAGQATPASDTYALACIAWEEEVLGSGTTRGCVGSADRPPCAGNCWR